MKKNLYLIGLIAFISCSDNTKKNTGVPSIIELADSYFERTLETFPEYAYYADIKLAKHNGFSSNELS